jgi:glycosyltransferase involved in cell wall biosynthesis
MTNSVNIPSVSVIINCYNSEKYLAKTIESILNQTYDDFEVIIVDNCSTDKTKEIIDSYDDKRINYYSTFKNLNLSEARNYALSKVRGNYIAFLDSDDIWIENKLSIQVKFLDDHPEYGGTFSNCYLIDERDKKIGVYKRTFKNSPYTFRELLKDYIVNIQTFIVRTKIIHENNLKFDNTLKLTEDIDLVLRISFYSQLYCQNNFLAKYRIHKNQDSFNFKIDFFDEEKYVIDSIFNDYKIDIKSYFEEFTLYSFNCLVRNINASMDINNNYKIADSRYYKNILKRLFYLIYIPNIFKKIIYKFIHKI